MITPARERHYDVLRTEVDIWLSPKLISGYTSSFNFSAIYKDNENDQDNENHPDNEKQGNYLPNKYMFKVNNLKSKSKSFGVFHEFQNRNWGLLHRKDFKWKKKYGGTGQVFEKRKLCLQSLTKEWKQPPVVILQQVNFRNIFILCLLVRIIKRV